MNLLLQAYLEQILKDRSFATIPLELADEIVMQHSTDKDDLVIEYLDNDRDATITTLEKSRQAVTYRENTSKLKAEQTQLVRIDEAISTLARSLSAGNEAMFRMIKHIVKYQKPDNYVCKLSLSPEDMTYFKNMKFK